MKRLSYIEEARCLKVNDYGLHIGQAATIYVFLCWHATPSKHNSQYKSKVSCSGVFQLAHDN